MTTEYLFDMTDYLNRHLPKMRGASMAHSNAFKFDNRGKFCVIHTGYYDVNLWNYFVFATFAEALAQFRQADEAIAIIKDGVVLVSVARDVAPVADAASEPAPVETLDAEYATWADSLPAASDDAPDANDDEPETCECGCELGEHGDAHPDCQCCDCCGYFPCKYPKPDEEDDDEFYEVDNFEDDWKWRGGYGGGNPDADLDAVDDLTLEEAIDYINANLVAIYNASRLRDALAFELVRCWFEFKHSQNIVSEELLINAVLAYQDNLAKA